VLELAVLGLLKEQSMHGYELKKRLNLKLGHFWQVSFGSLYPALNKLERQGAVERAYPKGEARRSKNVYRITAAGERLFAELLEASGPHDLEQDRFALRLAFFSYLRPEARIHQLEGRRGYLQMKLADFRASIKNSRERMDAYTEQLLAHGLDEREREIKWLDELIAAERGAGLPKARPAE